MIPIETNPEKNLPLDAALAAFTQHALGLAFPQSSFAGVFREIVQEHFHYPHCIFWRNSKTAGIAATAAALRACHGDTRAAALKILVDALPGLPSGQRLPTAKTIGNTLRHKTQFREPGCILADNFEGMPQEFAWACLQLSGQPDIPEINNANVSPPKSAANQIPKSEFGKNLNPIGKKQPAAHHGRNPPPPRPSFQPHDTAHNHVAFPVKQATKGALITWKTSPSLAALSS
ncbi:hypothetical protein OH491_24755 [Termitidicoccus mucosus]|uniref:Uncharacterized protein n=1 Tax=Termitidicoccus mucosus TaxID=1184151 RepID=A0A178IPQ0_9BACT|nr:hypothetical protein AW736_01770 [Opitutaceae bacterium TSB47]